MFYFHAEMVKAWRQNKVNVGRLFHDMKEQNKSQEKYLQNKNKKLGITYLKIKEKKAQTPKYISWLFIELIARNVFWSFTDSSDFLY